MTFVILTSILIILLCNDNNFEMINFLLEPLGRIMFYSLSIPKSANVIPMKLVAR